MSMRLSVCFMVLGLVLLSASLQAQQRISGRVTDNSGAGLPGISVQVKNAATGTSTGIDGNYSLNTNLTPGNYILVFSGIGFKTKETAFQLSGNNEVTVNQTLQEDVLGLDEVVVTGTSSGTTRKQLGSYIASVKGDAITKAAPPNVLAALQGKTPGAQITQNSGDPGGGMSVRLRGISTVNSLSEPLYIIDGVIVSNSARRVTNAMANYDGGGGLENVAPNRMIDINPADIERVEVLNGAAAAAIYGSRANAGVVQIFTKRGSSGKPVISFTTGVNLNQLRKSVGQSDAPVKFGGPTDGPTAQTQDILNTTLTSTTPVTRYNYWDYIFRDGIGNDNNISIRGGTDKTKYFVSLSHFFNQGIIEGTDFRRMSMRVNVDQELAKWVTLSAGLNYINSHANEKPDGNSFFSPMNSVTIIGNFHDIRQRDANGNIRAIGELGRVNPVSVIEDIKQKQETSRMIASLGLKMRPFRDFTLDYMMGIDNLNQGGSTFIPPYAYNVSTGFFGGGNPAAATYNPALNGYASVGANRQFLINHEINATLTKNIAPSLVSTTQLGYSLQYEKGDYSVLQGIGMPPGGIEVVSAAITTQPGIDSRSETSISGAYLQQNFKLKDRYFLTLAARLDGSSVFGEDQRDQLYLKASGSYAVSDEDFWEKMPSWWDFLKLRAAYGESGNLTGIGAFSRFNVYNVGQYIGRSAFTSPGQIANTSVKPEVQKELEVGTDMAFFNNRLSLTFNWYNKKVEDLLIARFIAPSNGYSSLLDNVGSLRNKGVELMLGGKPVAGKNFNWNIDVIYNRNRNRVEEIGQGLIQYNTISGAPVSLLPGYSAGVFYGFFFATDEGGKQITNAAGIPVQEKGTQNGPGSYTVGRDGNGLPTGTNLRKVIGDPNPDWTGTLVNTFEYKRASLRVQLDAVQGVDVFNADFRTRQGVGNGKEFAQREHKGELPRGYIAGVYAIEEWRIDDGSFVKLREVALNYNVGRLGKLISDLNISLSGRNLYSWDNYKGFDPETNAGGSSNLARGIDFGNVPIPRTYTLTFNAKF